MVKRASLLLAIAVAVIGVYGYLNYDLQTHYENGKLVYWKIVAKGAKPDNATPIDSPDHPLRPTIRIASFQLGRLDEAKLANRRVADVLAHLIPQFDLVAVQGVRGKNQAVLVRLIDQVNAASGRTYDFATCPTQRRDALEHYSAFLFDRARIDVDRATVHFVEDRLNRFLITPLVGAFRVRGTDPELAFTFTLINVETDPEHAAAELDLLADVYRAVRNDGRNEDDVIVLGDLEADDQHLGELGKLFGATALFSNVPTTTRGTRLADNMVIDRRATVEFTGRTEVIDLMRQFNLTMAEAMEVSEHLPICAEFSSYEGTGQP